MTLNGGGGERKRSLLLFLLLYFHCFIVLKCLGELGPVDLS